MIQYFYAYMYMYLFNVNARASTTNVVSAVQRSAGTK